MIKLYWLKLSINKKYIFSKVYNKNIRIIHIFNKNIYIYKKFLNIYIKVYNGKKFISIYINKYKLFKKLGSFVFTKFIKSNIKELSIN
uniref:Small subunit ribosomal protein 2 n=1 Tax=Leucocytozoon caulleryi TaxID=211597 RepID=U3TLU8_LEUCU|nr:small subunit ribosomal protein 2 [Leucocytozoon caulleryi]BAN94670.1 small subunit ribosomal protein 2 [Leucocytozoon caulleryi]